MAAAIFSTSGEDLEAVIVRQLTHKKATLAVAEAEDPLLRSRLVLVAATATEGGVEPVLGDGVEQRHGLQSVAAGTRSSVLHDATAIDALLHAGEIGRAHV